MAPIKPLTNRKTTGLHTLECAAVQVVYQTDYGTWRGFVHPYNITTEMATKEEAKETLADQLEVYEAVLEQEGYPAHLCMKHLTNERDKEELNRIALESLRAGKKIDTPTRYAEPVLTH